MSADWVLGARFHRRHPPEEFRKPLWRLRRVRRACAAVDGVLRPVGDHVLVRQPSGRLRLGLSGQGTQEGAIQHCLLSRPSAPPTGWATHRSRLMPRAQAQRVTHPACASADEGSEDAAEPSLLLEQGKVADEKTCSRRSLGFASLTAASCSPAARSSHIVPITARVALYRDPSAQTS